MSLVEFLLARLDEDGAAALTASNPPWVALTMFPTRSEVTNETEIDGGVIVSTPSKDDADVEHIARHDPARVLAEVAAKRRIVSIHKTIRAAYPGTTIETDPCCSECSAGGEYPGDFPCGTLRALASVYADHPDFDLAWT